MSALHADGMFGGVTPHGMVYVAFYSEHAKIPDAATLEVDGENKVIRQPRQVSRPAEWVREVGAEIIMTVETARAFRSWLDDKINALDQLQSEDKLTVTEEPQS